MFPSKNKEESTVTNNLHEAEHSIQNAANQAGRKVRKLYDSASHEISHASSAVTHEIRSNPVRSSAIALGAGVLLGMIFRPSRNRK